MECPHCGNNTKEIYITKDSKCYIYCLNCKPKDVKIKSLKKISV